MEFDVKQFGRRWFIVEILEKIDDHGMYQVEGEVEARYSVDYWNGNRKWTLTGNGSRKYRDGITEALESFVERDIPYKER